LNQAISIGHASTSRSVILTVAARARAPIIGLDGFA
jgi:hypothetical protein